MGDLFHGTGHYSHQSYKNNEQKNEHTKKSILWIGVSWIWYREKLVPFKSRICKTGIIYPISE